MPLFGKFSKLKIIMAGSRSRRLPSLNLRKSDLVKILKTQPMTGLTFSKGSMLLTAAASADRLVAFTCVGR